MNNKRLFDYLQQDANWLPLESDMHEITNIVLEEEGFKEIQDERERQDLKWGEQNHSPADYLTILMEEVGEASKAALEAKFGGKDLKLYRDELVQVAAVAVAMIECYDRNNKA